MVSFRRFGSIGTPARPMAMMMRPQLASAPAMAVLTSGELAMHWATWRACSGFFAPQTQIWISLRAPSPSRTICRASSCITSPNALANRAKSLAVVMLAPCPLENSRQVSLVEVSPSTLMALKVSAHSCLSSLRNAAAGSLASVNKNASIVAMFGAIMPEPLAMPLICTD